MIRLEITDPITGYVLVPHLPEGLSFEMIRENPLFTRRGEYTYDINISLRDPHNRAIYNHIDRLTSKSRPQNRKARLLCDGRVIADGVEVILSVQDDNIKIQILSGISETNILIGDNNLKIREMNFGTIEIPTLTKAKDVSSKFYPDTNYVFPMICKGSSTSAGYDNEYKRELTQNSNVNGVEYKDGTALWPQPYLLYYVEKFIELLGYTVVSNALRLDERWKRLVIISGYRSLEYAKMLPDWTAAKFVEEIERFFNCTIMIDGVNKTAKIVTAAAFYNQTETVKIEDDTILDYFECQYDEGTEDFVLANDNFRYKLPTSNYWMYKELPDDIDVRSEQVTAEIATARAEDDNDWKIYTSASLGFKFVFTKDRDSDGNVTMKRCWVINEYKHRKTKDSEWKEMSIIPAQTFIRFYDPSSTYDADRKHIGIVSAFPEYYDNSAANDFTANILGNGGEKASDTMQVAFFTGVTKAMIISQYEGDTLKVSDYYICMLQTTPNMITMSPFITDRNGTYLYQQYHKLTSYALVDDLTLELDGQHGRYTRDYNTNSIANLEDRFSISFKDSRILDPTAKFLIHGRLFVCQQLKYTYANGHQDPIVEGIFYPYI